MTYIIGDTVQDQERAEQLKNKGKDKIKFSCMKCGLCCSSTMMIPLSPLDIWWMKRKFQCHTSQIFDNAWVRVVIEEKTMLPRAIMNLREVPLEDGSKCGVCPFVEACCIPPETGRNDPCPCGGGEKYKKCCIDKGNKILCSIWEHRPATCRMYPLLYMIYWDNEQGDYETAFHLTRDTFCRGLNDMAPEIAVGDWVKQDDKLKYAIEYNIKFAYMLKDIRKKSYMDGNIKHDHINILANILYNFDLYLRPDDLKHVIFDREAMGAVAELVLRFMENPNQFSLGSASENRIIISGEN